MIKKYFLKQEQKYLPSSQILSEEKLKTIRRKNRELVKLTYGNVKKKKNSTAQTVGQNSEEC